ncbi:MAG TPA: hypothetical protein VFA26_20825, partial [Gemmataceae bacterium]|nr:hypothetical protein [Gemmataceae bacterium]
GSSTETVRGTFDYTESPKGFPILKSIVRTWADAKYTQEFDLTERNDVPDSEFTLSAFGLPEPAELQGKPSRVRWYLWAGVAGICCLALGAGFHWRSKRRVA